MEVSTCTSCPKMQGKISVHKLWMAIRNRCKDINALSLETKGLLDEVAGKMHLYTQIMLMTRLREIAKLFDKDFCGTQ